MSDGLDKIRERMADYLNAQGVAAVTAWPAEERLRREGAVAAVTLRACQAGPAGFQSYLGERYNQETEQWEEIYGRKVRLTFGLDLYALPQAGEAALQTALDILTQACAGAGPEGLAIQEFSSGETAYDGDSRLLRKPAQAVCTAYLYAISEGRGFHEHYHTRAPGGVLLLRRVIPDPRKRREKDRGTGGGQHQGHRQDGLHHHQL